MIILRDIKRENNELILKSTKEQVIHYYWYRLLKYKQQLVS